MIDEQMVLATELAAVGGIGAGMLSAEGGWHAGRVDTGAFPLNLVVFPQVLQRGVMDALLMAIWRRRSAYPVMVHSDQCSQFRSKDWRDFLTAHSLEPSMSQPGNCHDNAVAESFFRLLRRERIKRKPYATRDHARPDIFGYIECSTIRGAVTDLRTGFFPAKFERRNVERLTGV